MLIKKSIRKKILPYPHYTADISIHPGDLQKQFLERPHFEDRHIQDQNSSRKYCRYIFLGPYHVMFSEPQYQFLNLLPLIF
jgi:hypothetical protein